MLSIDRNGVAWSIQEVIAEVLDDAGNLSTYSWRRLIPTIAHTLALSPTELAALGDWTCKQDTPEEIKMPLHYSGARYAQSLRTKHLVLAAMDELGNTNLGRSSPRRQSM